MSCQTRIDASAMPCFQFAQALLNSYYLLLSGQRRVEIRHGEQWVRYDGHSPADTVALRDLYSNVRASCPEALAKLPGLEAGSRVRRGPPMGICIKG